MILLNYSFLALMKVHVLSDDNENEKNIVVTYIVC